MENASEFTTKSEDISVLSCSNLLSTWIRKWKNCDDISILQMLQIVARKLFFSNKFFELHLFECKLAKLFLHVPFNFFMTIENFLILSTLLYDK